MKLSIIINYDIVIKGSYHIKDIMLAVVDIVKNLTEKCNEK